MARMVDADQLVGAVDIANRLGVAGPQTVHEWRRRDLGFPAPVAVISRVSIWEWPTVLAWARDTGRAPATRMA